MIVTEDDRKEIVYEINAEIIRRLQAPGVMQQVPLNTLALCSIALNADNLEEIKDELREINNQ